MATRTIEIEDNMEEIIEDCKKELLDNFCDYLLSNLGIEEFDTYYQAQGCEHVQESADNNTPIYNDDIDGLYFLYGSELDGALEGAGIDTEPGNRKQTAIYCYISQEVFEFMGDSLENDLFTRFTDLRNKFYDENNPDILKGKLEEEIENWTDELFPEKEEV